MDWSGGSENYLVTYTRGCPFVSTGEQQPFFIEINENFKLIADRVNISVTGAPVRY